MIRRHWGYCGLLILSVLTILAAAAAAEVYLAQNRR